MSGNGRWQDGAWTSPAEIEIGPGDEGYAEKWTQNEIDRLNSIERMRASIEDRPPKLRKLSKVKRSAQKAAAMKDQLAAEIERRKWARVMARLTPLVVEASGYVQELRHELAAAPPLEASKDGFPGMVSWRSSKRNELKSAEDELKRLEVQHSSHSGLLADAAHRSGYARRRDEIAKAEAEVSAGAAKLDAAHKILEFWANFAEDVSQGIAAMKSAGKDPTEL